MGAACSRLGCEEINGCQGDANSQVHVCNRPNLIFPNEVLEKILEFLSFRDVLVAREVCKHWLHYINFCGYLQATMKVKISSDELEYLSSQEPVFTGFLFHKVDVTRQSVNFWNVYSDFITHLEFYDCAIIPRNASGSLAPSFELGCPNLKYLGLVNCDKYFLMGGSFIQLDEILCLENLETLNLSQNKNLTDRILLSLLMKTTRLKMIDLSDCINLVYTKAVHNRFYPPGKIITSYSDHILSFYSLDQEFLSTEKASEMVGFNFGMRLNSVGMEVLLHNDRCKWKFVNLESSELKPSDVTQFLEKFHKSLEKVELGRCKLLEENVTHAQLNQLKYISIYDSRINMNVVNSLHFLSSTPNLTSLKIDGCCRFSLRADAFANVPNLKELSINGIMPIDPPDVCKAELVKIFQSLRHLTSLEVGNIPDLISDAVSYEILKIKHLRRLNLKGANLTDSGLVILKEAAFDPPRNFSLESILPNVFLSLADLTNLEHLDLSHCSNLTDLTWRIGCRFVSLSTLNLSNCSRLSKAGVLSIIDNCRNLEKLVMVNCPAQIITDSDVVSATREKLYRCKGIIY